MEFLTWICTLEILRWIKLVLLHLTVKKTQMSAKGGSVTGSVRNEENSMDNSTELSKIEMTDTELSKIEMTDTTDNEALLKESFNIDESETNGEANPRENQSLEGEEVDDQVRTTCTVLELTWRLMYGAFFCACSYILNLHVA